MRRGKFVKVLLTVLGMVVGFCLHYNGHCADILLFEAVGVIIGVAFSLELFSTLKERSKV